VRALWSTFLACLVQHLRQEHSHVTAHAHSAHLHAVAVMWLTVV
jgi:hypothetical protein